MSKHMILLLPNFGRSFMDVNKLGPNFVSRVKPLNPIKDLLGDSLKESTPGPRIYLFLGVSHFGGTSKPSLVTFHTSGDMASRYAAMRTFQ